MRTISLSTSVFVPSFPCRILRFAGISAVSFLFAATAVSGQITIDDFSQGAIESIVGGNLEQLGGNDEALGTNSELSSENTLGGDRNWYHGIDVSESSPKFEDLHAESIMNVANGAGSVEWSLSGPNSVGLAGVAIFGYSFSPLDLTGHDRWEIALAEVEIPAGDGFLDVEIISGDVLSRWSYSFDQLSSGTLAGYFADPDWQSAGVFDPADVRGVELWLIYGFDQEAAAGGRLEFTDFGFAPIPEPGIFSAALGIVAVTVVILVRRRSRAEASQ